MISTEKAITICSRILKTNKPQLTPITCYNCYYHDSKCELGKNDSPICIMYKDDVSFSNTVHKKILNDYDWCVEHYNDFCQLDKELFIAIHTKVFRDLII